MRHDLGVGVGSTGGAVYGRTRNLTLTSPEIGLLDINVIARLTTGIDLQLWLPLSLIIWNNVAFGDFFEGALLLRLHPVRSSGFYLGPGIDLLALSDRGQQNADWTFTMPLAIGYETDYPQGGFGFTIALRPMVGLLVDGDSARPSRTGLAYGVLLEMDVIGYLAGTSSRAGSFSMGSRY